MSYDLSILIPARNEEWLPQTVADLLKNKRGKTEILVGLDGYKAEIPPHEDVTVVFYPESIGQRAMQNRLAKISKAKYVMKADAHTAWDEGFDVKMLAAAEANPDATLVPVMRNLHVFNWKCNNCDLEIYQGPEPRECNNEICPKFDGKTDGGEGHSAVGFKKNVVWIPKTNPQSSAYRFNKNLQFKYFPELRNKLERKGLQETMSLQGSCFMCSRKNYWDLELCDESWGSWGQQGSEVAIKTWLSGGRVLCNFNTWYAHLFRTQQGFSFPYPHSGSSQQRARQISQDIFLNNKWSKQKHPLSWLLKKFWFALKDVSDQEAKWTEEDIKQMEPTKGIIYFTDNRLDPKIMKMCQDQLVKTGLPIVSASLQPIDFGKNLVLPLERGWHTYFKQILAALEASSADMIFFCEHDVLYPQSHFDFTPPTKIKFYYNQNWVKVRWPYDGTGVSWDADQVSGLCCDRKLAIEFYKEKVATFDKESFDRKFEPGSGINSEVWRSAESYVDIRQEYAQTKNKWSINDFRNKLTAVNFKETKCPEWAKQLVENR